MVDIWNPVLHQAPTDWYPTCTHFSGDIKTRFIGSIKTRSVRLKKPDVLGSKKIAFDVFQKQKRNCNHEQIKFNCVYGFYCSFRYLDAALI